MLRKMQPAKALFPLFSKPSFMYNPPISRLDGSKTGYSSEKAQNWIIIPKQGGKYGSPADSAGELLPSGPMFLWQFHSGSCVVSAVEVSVHTFLGRDTRKEPGIIFISVGSVNQNR